MTSKREIKRKIQKQYHGEISEKTITILQNINDEIIKNLIKISIIEFEKENRYRTQAGIQTRKRLMVSQQK